MNEFTKEELELIYYHLENEPAELTNKIKFMINNYKEENEKSFNNMIGELNQKLSDFILKDFESAFSVKTLNKNNFEEFAQKLKDLGLQK